MYPFSEQDDLPLYARRRSIFDNPNQPWSPNLFQGMTPPDITANPTSVGGGGNDFASLYKQISSQPEGPAQSRYRQFLDTNLPSKEDRQFRPGVTDRIAAILSGLSTGITKGAGEGYATAQNILDQPYKEATERYKLQGGRFGEAARIEQENELNRVKLIRDMLESNDRQANTARQAREAIDRSQHWQRQDKTGESRAAREGFHFNVNALTGNLEGVRANPQAVNGIEKLDFGKAGQTPEEKITTHGRMAGAAAEATLPIDLKKIGAGGEQARETKSQPSYADLHKPGSELPTQVKIRQFSAARQLKNSNPELAPFITLRSGNDFDITPPNQGRFWNSGPTPEQYKSITDYIYGQGQPAISQPSRTGKSISTTSKAQAGPKEVIITDLAGKTLGTISEEDVPKLDKTKYRVKQ